jgi:hypothetical protein
MASRASGFDVVASCPHIFRRGRIVLQINLPNGEVVCGSPIRIHLRIGPAVTPARVVRGQYGAGTVLGKEVKPYRQDRDLAHGVDHRSLAHRDPSSP